MFISKNQFEDTRQHIEDLRCDGAVLRQEAKVLSEQNRFLQTTLDWMRIRLTQVEHVRAQMLYNFTGVKVQVPSIEREMPPCSDPRSVSDILAAVNHFGDVGDIEAAKLGVSWADDGSVSYGN